MTLRDAIEAIGEAEDAVYRAIKSEEIKEVKRFVKDAAIPLKQATEIIYEVANDIDSAIILLKPNKHI